MRSQCDREMGQLVREWCEQEQRQKQTDQTYTTHNDTHTDTHTTHTQQDEHTITQQLIMTNMCNQFTQTAVRCLQNGLGRRTPRKTPTERKIRWDEQIRTWKAEYRTILKKWRRAPTQHKEQLWESAKRVKRQIKNRVKWIAKGHKIEKMMEFENLRGVDMRTYWKSLKEMAGWQKQSQPIPDTVKNECGKMQTDREAVKQAWNQAFHRLGIEDEEDQTFEPNRLKQIKEQLRRIKESDRRTNLTPDMERMNRQITREEVGI